MVPRDGERSFESSRPRPSPGAFKLVGVDGLAPGTVVTLIPDDPSNPSPRLQFKIRLSPSTPGGMIEGKLRLSSMDGTALTMDLIGMAGPGRPSPSPKSIVASPEPRLSIATDR